MTTLLRTKDESVLIIKGAHLYNEEILVLLDALY